VLLPKGELQAAAAMCAAAGTWLLLDATYEDFVYGGQCHHSVAGANVVNVFSFSKAYGMMGWRVRTTELQLPCGYYTKILDLQ
jgi:aspartate/methionine/tyrosine aminotransferase